MQVPEFNTVLYNAVMLMFEALVVTGAALMVFGMVAGRHGEGAAALPGKAWRIGKIALISAVVSGLIFCITLFGGLLLKLSK